MVRSDRGASPPAPLLGGNRPPDPGTVDGRVGGGAQGRALDQGRMVPLPQPGHEVLAGLGARMPPAGGVRGGRRPPRLTLATLALLPLLAGPARAQDPGQVVEGSGSDWGGVGLIEMRNARFRP